MYVLKHMNQRNIFKLLAAKIDGFDSPQLQVKVILFLCNSNSS